MIKAATKGIENSTVTKKWQLLLRAHMRLCVCLWSGSFVMDWLDSFWRVEAHCGLWSFKKHFIEPLRTQRSGVVICVLYQDFGVSDFGPEKKKAPW